jgi:stearoyl-CoA desaturase (delta-9 desaturase)
VIETSVPNSPASTRTRPVPAPRPAGATPDPAPGGLLVGRIVTAALVVSPVVALGVAVPLLWGSVIHLRDAVLAVVLYLVTAVGVTVGFHRMLTHRSFRPNRALKIALAAAGSMALEGGVIGWVAAHRRHHRFSDAPGDPHSPQRFGRSAWDQLRGFLWAHVGWLFSSDLTSTERYAPDLLRDGDLVVLNRLFPLVAIASLGIPFGIGWWLSGSWAGALAALVWAGVLRMALLHHVTWSINSVCHMFGRRRFASADDSTDFAPLALLSLGESWHNFHHAVPSSARHGVLAHQLDLSAELIRLFERLGWATHVRWPQASTIRAALLPAGPTA